MFYRALASHSYLSFIVLLRLTYETAGAAVGMLASPHREKGGRLAKRIDSLRLVQLTLVIGVQISGKTWNYFHYNRGSCDSSLGRRGHSLHRTLVFGRLSIFSSMHFEILYTRSCRHTEKSARRWIRSFRRVE